MSITEHSLIERLKKQFPEIREIEILIKTHHKNIYEALLRGEKVKLKNIGSLIKRLRRQSVKTFKGQLEEVECKTVKFTPSVVLKRNI